MAYPWPSFSTFQWTKQESPVFGSDTGWQVQQSFARNKVLGGLADSIIVLSRGSLERRFACYLSMPRFAQLQALIGVSGQFCDWDRPTPDARAAILMGADATETVITGNRDGQTDADNRALMLRRKVEITFVSQ
jgi:hypothetical protein